MRAAAWGRKGSSRPPAQSRARAAHQNEVAAVNSPGPVGNATWPRRLVSAAPYFAM